MKHTFFLSVLMLTLTLGASATNVTYTADNTTDFCNPERGFYDHVEWTVTSGSSNLSSSYLTEALAENRTLILRLYYLNNYRSADLPNNFITQFGNDMALLRQYGCKAIIRFAYDDNTSDGYQDGSLTYWKKHLDQLKQVMADNADVIYVVQAGFLGVWGEWYYSAAGTGTAIPSATKTQLIDKLLDCVPASRFVQLRTPKFKRDYTGYTAAMSASDAYQNTSRARLGHHNDAFLNGETNSGTYTNRTNDMAYLAQECLYVPNGGENNVSSQSTYNSWATGAKAKAEMAQLHYSYMNAGYDEFTTNKWKSEGAFAEMSRNLGYRFQLTSAVLPATGTVGKIVNVQLNIKNVGYAPLYYARPAYIVLKNSSKTYKVKLATDPRTWQPNGAATAISENITLPSDMVAGTYQLYLWMPDASSSIASKPAYAVRFANTGVWDSTTGYNKLNASIVVSTTGGDEPGPTTGVDTISHFQASAVDASSIALSWTNPTGSSSPTTEAIALASCQSYASAGTATPSVSGTTLQVNYSNVSQWEVAGVQVTLGSRSDITSVSYTLQGDGQDVDFIAYLTDAEEANWYNATQDLSSTTATTYTLTPTQQLWTTKTHTAGSQPYTTLYFVANPSAVTPTSGSFKLSNITLNLKGGGTTPAQFTQVKIVRKTGSYPTSVTDGTVVYSGSAASYTDTKLAASTQYCYAAYSYNGTAVSGTVAKASATTAAAPGPSGDAYTLPGTLQAADATLSGFTLTDGKIRAEPYEDAPSAYATWPVQVQCTGSYSISAVVSTTNGYKLEFYVQNAGGTTVAQQVVSAKYNTGDHMTVDYGTISLTAGTYTFLLKNNLEWTEAYIHSVTLSNPDCTISTDIDYLSDDADKDGKFIYQGQLYIRHQGRWYNALGLPY